MHQTKEVQQHIITPITKRILLPCLKHFNRQSNNGKKQSIERYLKTITTEKKRQTTANKRNTTTSKHQQQNHV
jgi:hypothetical protein